MCNARVQWTCELNTCNWIGHLEVPLILKLGDWGLNLSQGYMAIWSVCCLGQQENSLLLGLAAVSLWRLVTAGASSAVA